LINAVDDNNKELYTARVGGWLEKLKFMLNFFSKNFKQGDCYVSTNS